MAHGGSQGAVLSHWYRLLEGLQASPLEFYQAVEQGLAQRQVPDTRTSRIDWREGGMATARREYLRVARGAHTFDLCAAPFGTGFFVSSWLAEVRPSPVGPTLAALAILAGLWWYLDSLVLTAVVFAGLFLLVGVLLSQREHEWNPYVLAVPVLGPAWERLFAPQTYFRIDSGLMFQSAVHASVLEVIDGLTKVQGLRPLTEDERKPILRDFYER